MTELHLITHTHWDREWYLPYQVFRMKLVDLVDKLLNILTKNPDYHYFMLDGQTIVLEDYLEIRPQNRALLEKYIKDGKIQIGPWYILPDEFLVSGEATIRNLLVGKQICEEFGKRMMIGYIPDPFGHIAQMPQLLKGFGIDYACFRRGLADEQVELWWQSPDGSRVLTSYLRDGYDNAMHLPLEKETDFISEVNRLAGSLKPFVHAGHLLLMNGSDHIEPDNRTSKFIDAYIDSGQQDILVHSTLEKYFAKIEANLVKTQSDLLIISGEQRECKRHELLPAVLSSRIWIKQRNHDCEKLLEKWVEPFSVFTMLQDNFDVQKAAEKKQLIDYAWKSLFKCHPHDSICGCSIDQVHLEMETRFDQVKQIGERIVGAELEALAKNIDTTGPTGAASAIVVFNACQYTQTGVVNAAVPLPAGSSGIIIIDEEGCEIPIEQETTPYQSLADLCFDREGMQSAAFMLSEGKISGMSVLDIGMRKTGHHVEIELVLDQNSVPNFAALDRGKQKIQEFLTDSGITDYSFKARTPVICHLHWIADKVPGLGYSTYWIKPAESGNIISAPIMSNSIENEYFMISVDEKVNKIHLLDKRTGYAISGFNQFEDTGDAGDEYNYNPPDIDQLINSTIKHFEVVKTELGQKLFLTYEMNIPAEITPDRKSRSSNMTSIEIKSELTLNKDIPRVDIRTSIDNRAKDHRTRVLFPTGIKTDQYFTDNQFVLTERIINKYDFQSGWVEQPRPEVPQKLFCFVNDENKGLLVANQGLPEVEVFKDSADEDVIAITLLRCTGWLSRDDLKLRPHSAGPNLETPGAQEIGTHVYTYSIIPFGDDRVKAIQQARQFDLPLKTISTDIRKGTLPSEMCFLEVNPTEFELTACKISEDNKSWILRGVNQTGQDKQVKIDTELHVNKASYCSLDEVPTVDMYFSEGKLEIESKAHQINTVRLE